MVESQSPFPTEETEAQRDQGDPKVFPGSRVWQNRDDELRPPDSQPRPFPKQPRGWRGWQGRGGGAPARREDSQCVQGPNLTTQRRDTLSQKSLNTAACKLAFKVREGLSKEATYEPRSEGWEGTSWHCKIRARGPERLNGLHKVTQLAGALPPPSHQCPLSSVSVPGPGVTGEPRSASLPSGTDTARGSVATHLRAHVHLRYPTGLGWVPIKFYLQIGQPTLLLRNTETSDETDLDCENILFYLGR